MPANAPLSSTLRVRVSEDEPISLTQQLMEAWSPPDPDMHQREYGDSELEDQFSNMDESVEERSPPRNLLLTMRQWKHQIQVKLHTKMTKSQTITTVLLSRH